MLIDIVNFTEHDLQVLHVEAEWRKVAERYYRIVSVDSQISRGNDGQLEEARHRLAIEDSSLVIKGVWRINRESANISRIKAPSTIRDAIQKRMAGARRTVKLKQN